MARAAGGTGRRTALPGHQHVPLQGEKQTGRTDPNAELQVTLILRRRHELPELHSPLGDKFPLQRHHLSRQGLHRGLLLGGESPRLTVDDTECA